MDGVCVPLASVPLMLEFHMIVSKTPVLNEKNTEQFVQLLPCKIRPDDTIRQTTLGKKGPSGSRVKNIVRIAVIIIKSWGPWQARDRIVTNFNTVQSRTPDIVRVTHSRSDSNISRTKTFCI